MPGSASIWASRCCSARPLRCRPAPPTVPPRSWQPPMARCLVSVRPWPVYTAGSAVYLSQNVPNSSPMPAVDFLAAHNCAFWDTILIY